MPTTFAPPLTSPPTVPAKESRHAIANVSIGSAQPDDADGIAARGRSASVSRMTGSPCTPTWRIHSRCSAPSPAGSSSRPPANEEAIGAEADAERVLRVAVEVVVEAEHPRTQLDQVEAGVAGVRRVVGPLDRVRSPLPLRVPRRHRPRRSCIRSERSWSPIPRSRHCHSRTGRSAW